MSKFTFFFYYLILLSINGSFLYMEKHCGNASVKKQLTILGKRNLLREILLHTHITDIKNLFSRT